MANRRSPSASGRRQAGLKPRNSAIPGGLRGAIEEERGKLTKAESLLGCLVISMEYGHDSQGGPHFPDVAQVACDLVRQSIDGLDSLTLERVTGRSRVREDSAPPVCSAACSSSPCADSGPASGGFLPVRSALQRYREWRSC